MEAFNIDIWIEQYSQKLYNRAYYLLSNCLDTEDVVQDVFLVAFEKKAQFNGKSSALTWLMSILHHKISDRYRLKYKIGTSISLDSFFDDDDFWKNPEGLLKEWQFTEPTENESFEDYLERCLEALPQKWRLIIKLSYLQGKKTADICQEIDVSTTNYWKILQRSRFQLRECIEQKIN